MLCPGAASGSQVGLGPCCRAGRGAEGGKHRLALSPQVWRKSQTQTEGLGFTEQISDGGKERLSGFLKVTQLLVAGQHWGHWQWKTPEAGLGERLQHPGVTEV